MGSGYNLQATYEWEDEEWIVDIYVWQDETYFDWRLDQRSSNCAGGQCKTIKDAVFACVDAILKRINKRVADYQLEQQKARDLSEYNREAQGWADKANSVSIED